MMEYKNSAELMRKMANRCNGETMLAFSCGKDSISAWVELRKYFTKITPVYYYQVPNLSFIESSLNYYEDFFQTEIIRLPNPLIYRMLNSGMYQTPQTNKIIQSFQFPIPTREQMAQFVREDFKVSSNAYLSVGNRMADNPLRRLSIKTKGAVSEKQKKWFPIYDYLIEDVVRSIREAGVKLPADYHLFGKSFDGLSYRFIEPVKRYYPADYKKIRAFFPFIDNEIMKYECL